LESSRVFDFSPHPGPYPVCAIFLIVKTKGGSNVMQDKLNPVDLRVPVSIHPELKELTRHYERKIYRIGDNAYCAVGIGLANSGMIVGGDGIIIFDANREVETAQEILKEFRKITDKPIKAVIYSHFHPDHTGGIKGFISEEDVKSGRVEIIAHGTMMDRLTEMESKALPIFSQRLRYQFGAYLDGEDIKDMSSGMGPLLRGGSVSFIPPTKTFKNRLEVTISGVRLVLFHVPSESEDQIALYLPDNRALFVGDMIHGPSFPNLYPLWGDRGFRDPEQWARCFNMLLSFKPKYFVPMHGQPVYGDEKCVEVISNYRDAFQFVNDQTIRYMNKGHTPGELVELVQLPPHLSNVKPYLRDYVGSVELSVRRVFEGYLGWFEGDAIELSPTPPPEKTKRLVDMMGGRETVLEASKKAYLENDYQWAAELLTYLIRLDNNDIEARDLKAAALRHLGYRSMNAQWRHWYLTSARELEGTLPAQHKMSFDVADVIRLYPSDFIIGMLTSQLRAEDTYDIHMTLGIDIADTREKYYIELRRGVAIVHDKPMENVDVEIRMTRDFLNRSKFQPNQMISGIESADVDVAGKKEDAVRFFGFFENIGEDEINISLH
jgi:alkyl sulfatase BDS1-like metallo-beta-lactamase superfamily hydrolase